MEIKYAKSYFRFKKRMTDPIDRDQAQILHSERKPYVAVLSQQSIETCFLEFNDSYIGVGYFDKLKREYLSYQFNESENGKIFLGVATYREYEEDSDRVIIGTTFHFHPNGRVVVKVQDFITNKIDIKEKDQDVHGNWEMYPEFGEYESIVRLNR